MPDTVIILTAGQLPEGFCFQSPQQYYEAIIAATTAVLPGAFNTFNFGNSTPAPEDQDKPWLRTDTFGNIDKWYTFNGVWVALNPRPASGDERMIWVGSEADLWSYDGGDGADPGVTPPTDTTGAMWEVDTDFEDRFPIGASGTRAVGTTGGATTNSHNHTITNPITFAAGGVVAWSQPATDNEVISIMPPWRAVYVAKRTVRQFYTP